MNSTKIQDRKKGEMTRALRNRVEVPREETWNLTRVYASDAAWEKSFTLWKQKFDQVVPFMGQLGDPDRLLAWLDFESDLARNAERLMLYAYLKSVEDVTNPVYQDQRGRIQSGSILLARLCSFARPELLALSDEQWARLIENEALIPWRLQLERVRRYKPHTLSADEEKILAASGEMAGTANHVFSMLNDSDLSFEPVVDAKGTPLLLTNGTFQALIQSPDIKIREQAFKHLYNGYGTHQNTLAAALEGSVKKDVFYARTQNYSDSLEAALFDDEVPRYVYDHLVSAVRKTLPVLYRYYEIRRKRMGLRKIHFYDTYAPILPRQKKEYSWEQGVDMVLRALAPLGPDYIRTLKKGLTTGRWCDRYENRNKQSGAFSYPSYDYAPYMMLNYMPTLLDSVFTLAHEAGHSMHSWYSAHTQSYPYYDYGIFLAEIASTFNEELLSAMLLEEAETPLDRAHLLCREIDAFRGTIFRQTMFSEFERRVHEQAESGGTLPAPVIRALYRELLDEWFGPKFVIDSDLELECLRIPHFYHAFYVYKYATGMASAMTLADRVRTGGSRERDDYFELLRGGCSAPPLEILARAGVDMTRPDAVQAAMDRFSSLIDDLDKTLRLIK